MKEDREVRSRVTGYKTKFGVVELVQAMRMDPLCVWTFGHDEEACTVLALPENTSPTMIMSNTIVGTLSMDVGTVRFTIAPLLQSRFTVCKLRATSGARGASSFFHRLLCADSPLEASTTNASAWGLCVKGAAVG